MIIHFWLISAKISLETMESLCNAQKMNYMVPPSEVFSSLMETKKLDQFKLMMPQLVDQLTRPSVLSKDSNMLISTEKCAQQTGNQDLQLSSLIKRQRKSSLARHILTCELSVLKSITSKDMN